MTRLLSASVARGFGSFIAPLSTALLAIWLLAPLLLLADSVNSNQRTVTKLAEGIYLIRHKNAPDHFSQGNTVVIIGDTGVLVVDSCYLPSSAREDIAQIRQWTNKPVRYLLNTHWHNDHNQGNAAYADAFPELTIIAQTEKNQVVPVNWFTTLSSNDVEMILILLRCRLRIEFAAQP